MSIFAAPSVSSRVRGGSVLVAACFCGGGSTTSGWSTRFGAALRHSGRCLAGERSSAKAVILVTDGEPSDIDVFDQRYLVEDARKAIDELSADGIRCFCVNLDPSARAVVSTIFGQKNCATVGDTVRLPVALERALVRVTG